LAVALWFLFSYSNVPSWVWIFFGTAILIVIIGVLMKEFLLTRTITTCGRDITSGSYTFWSVLYIIFYLMAFALIITGLVFVIQYSSIPWWTWVILGIAILLSILGDVSVTASPRFGFFALILAISAFILFVTGLILLIIYSNAPSWVWVIVGVAILFAILAAICEGMSYRNYITVVKTCFDNCPLSFTPVATIQPTITVQPTPVINVEPVPIMNVQPIDPHILAQQVLY